MSNVTLQVENLTASDGSMGAINFSPNGAATSKNYGGVSITLNDDEVRTLNPGRTEGVLIISPRTANIATYNAILVYRTVTGSEFTQPIIANGSIFIFTTGILTGTTGADAKITVSTHQGIIYIENRSGAPRAMSFVLL